MEITTDPGATISMQFPMFDGGEVSLLSVLSDAPTVIEPMLDPGEYMQESLPSLPAADITTMPALSKAKTA